MELFQAYLKIELFNRAASRVTRKYRGFHQVGFDETTGYTAWELWNLPEDIDPYQVVREIEEEIKELRNLGF